MASQHHQHPPNRINRLNEELSIALLYHDIFGYPMAPRELSRWSAGRGLRLRRGRPGVEQIEGYYVLRGRGELVSERVMRQEYSRAKMKLLSKVKHIFEREKNILVVAVTGSLAMVSAVEESDVDLLIITRAGWLWTTRGRVLLSLMRNKVSTRRAGEREPRDKLCLNIWMDEGDLQISGPRNAYTAHEIAQIVPLINRERTYERFLAANDWVLDYWPNAVQVQNSKFKAQNHNLKLKTVVLKLMEKIAYFLQRLYMARKITREVVTPTRAFFHPRDWSKRVVAELARRGVVHV